MTEAQEMVNFRKRMRQIILEGVLKFNGENPKYSIILFGEDYYISKETAINFIKTTFAGITVDNFLKDMKHFEEYEKFEEGKIFNITIEEGPLISSLLKGFKVPT